MKPKKRIALIGSTGMLASKLIPLLSEKENVDRLIVIGLRTPRVATSKMFFYKLDLTQPMAGRQMAKIFKKEEVDTVIHIAYLSVPTYNRQWAHEFEVIGTLYVLHAVADAKVKHLIVRSSTLVYGASPSNPSFITEDHYPRNAPAHSFFSDKVEADREVVKFAEAHPEVVVTILRSCGSFGPNCDNFITRYLSRPVVPYVMGYDPLWQLIHEDDLVRAYLVALEKQIGGAFNIVGKGVMPVTQIINYLGRIGVPIPYPVFYRMCKAMWLAQLMDMPPSYIDYVRYPWVADGSKAKRMLGFEPKYNIRETLDSFLNA